MEQCGLAALLSAGGPVRVAVRPCCLVALVGRGTSVAGSSVAGSSVEASSIEASSVELRPEVEDGVFACAAAEAEAAELRVSS